MSEPTFSGSGGDLGYLTEIATTAMCNQQGPFTCVAACVRQLLLDAGIDRSEDDLLAEIGYYEGVGCEAFDIESVINRWHTRLDYKSGNLIDPDTTLYLSRDPWIAILLTDRGSRHSVIVDGGDRSEIHVRDPWGLNGPGSRSGTMATMSRSEFDRRWKEAGHAGVVPHQLKGQRP